MPTPGITSISQIIPVTKSQQQAKSVTDASSMSKDFGEMLSGAINNLAETENTANAAIADLAAGKDVDLHQVMLSMQEADIAFQVALQTRNKIVDAYQEIMRMQV